VSGPLAIGAVSAVLRNLLDNGIVDAAAPIGAVNVTAVAPDRIDLEDASLPPTLNLFLYRVSHNPGWRNQGVPTRDAAGRRTSAPPLALDLHYLLTAYAAEDFHAEILLGYAMHLLHERPVLDRSAIHRALDPSPLGTPILPPAFQSLAASDLANQLEAVTISPEPMDSEELSRLWAAFQTHYRPSTAYLVSTVLIETPAPARDALPVLSLGPVDPGTGRDRGVLVTPGLQLPFPTVESVAPPARQPATRLGETVRIRGHHLAGTGVTVQLEHRLLTEPHVLALPDHDDPTGLDVTLPSGAAAATAWPAGVYTVRVTLVPPDETEPRTSNVVAMLLAPTFDLTASSIVRDAGTGAVRADLALSPVLRPEQDARLAVGGVTAPADRRTDPTSTPRFELGPVPAGPQWMRLTVDGVDSLLIDRSDDPPVFDPSHEVVVPA
jgi:hypothetical protein